MLLWGAQLEQKHKLHKLKFLISHLKNEAPESVVYETDYHINLYTQSIVIVNKNIFALETDKYKDIYAIYRVGQ
jgi:hypothetical protein